jgi:hypothetical protein
MRPAGDIVWHMRMRIKARSTYSPDNRKRDGEMRMQPAAPLYTLEECSGILGLTLEQVKYLHESALQKLGAALSAYGYHEEFRKGL